MKEKRKQIAENSVRRTHKYIDVYNQMQTVSWSLRRHTLRIRIVNIVICYRGNGKCSLLEWRLTQRCVALVHKLHNRSLLAAAAAAADIIVITTANYYASMFHWTYQLLEFSRFSPFFLWQNTHTHTCYCRNIVTNRNPFLIFHFGLPCELFF